MSIFIRGLDICSPFFLAPINTGFGIRSEPDSRLLHFHEERSGRDIGISYVGNVAISGKYVSNPSTLVLESSARSWIDLTNVIRASGSRAGIQLACKLPSIDPSRRWRSRSDEVFSYISRASGEISSLSTSEISAICQQFITAAGRAIDSGFEVVQIHAAHGYFLSQLMNRKINARKDKYSSTDIEAIREIILGVRRANRNAVIDIRVSLFDGLDELETEKKVRQEHIRLLIEAGADVISLTAGMYEVDRFSIYPKAEAGHAVHLQAGRAMASSNSKTFWNIAGNIWDITLLDLASVPNLTYAIGRSLIADPSFVRKSLKGKGDTICRCVRSGHCHYYSRGIPHIECKVNHNV